MNRPCFYCGETFLAICDVADCKSKHICAKCARDKLGWLQQEIVGRSAFLLNLTPARRVRMKRHDLIACFGCFDWREYQDDDGGPGEEADQ